MVFVVCRLNYLLSFLLKLCYGRIALEASQYWYWKERNLRRKPEHDADPEKDVAE